MATNIFQRIQGSLAEKRQNLTEFLNSAPEEKKDLCCENENDVHAHLLVVETTMEKAENQALGVCTVCHGRVNPGLLEMDYTATVCLDHYSEPERRRLETELEFSTVIQRALLPQELPDMPGVELSAFTRPAAIVGGDYFDFITFRDGAHGLVIADIPGHGVSAGMMMSSLQTAIRTMVPETDSPADVLDRINRFYIHNIHFTTFVTIFLARFDPVTHTLTYANAGHNPPVAVHKQKAEVTWLFPTASAIGLAEKFHSQTKKITLEHGDVLFLYTDGVTEAFNPGLEQFGMERLSELLMQNANLSATDLIQTVRRGLETFSEGHELEDDTTFVALKLIE